MLGTPVSGTPRRHSTVKGAQLLGTRRHDDHSVSEIFPAAVFQEWRDFAQEEVFARSNEVGQDSLTTTCTTTQLPRRHLGSIRSTVGIGHTVMKPVPKLSPPASSIGKYDFDLINIPGRGRRRG